MELLALILELTVQNHQKNQFSGKVNINHNLNNNTSILGQGTSDKGTLYSKNIDF